MAIDFQTTQHLTKLLAKPALVTQDDAALLEDLVRTYPFYQPLHLLLAKAVATKEDSTSLATASLYNGGGLLHKVLYHPESFVVKPIDLVQPKKKTVTEPIVESEENSPAEHDYSSTAQNEEDVFEEINEILPHAGGVIQKDESTSSTTVDEQAGDEEIAEEFNGAQPATEDENLTEEKSYLATPEEQGDEEVFEEINEVLPNTEEETPIAEEPLSAPREEQTEETVFEEVNENMLVSEREIVTPEQTDEEVFEEINESLPNTEEEIPIAEESLSAHTEEENDEEVFEEINESLPNTERESPTAAESLLAATVEQADEEVLEEADENHTPTEDTSIEGDVSITQHEQNNTTSDTENELPEVQELLPDELAIGSIVATDFFAFEQNFSTDANAGTPNTVPVTFTPPEEYNVDAEGHTVSKYDDDKLPYTFLWWLAKTRKEHAQIFQPYVAAKREPTQIAGELQHQYVEHIFHLQTPFNIADEANKVTEQSVSHRGEDIIDSFIKNEPQIGAPKAELINNENKAKKSAEDSYDLVSETLAAIYIEQMLYHKAIDTYEKLSLKFPEKSRYFADLIQSLEKKI